MIAPDGSEYPTAGVYREVVEPERLVFTWGIAGRRRRARHHRDAGGPRRAHRDAFHLVGIAGVPGDENVYDGWDSRLRRARRIELADDGGQR